MFAILSASEIDTLNFTKMTILNLGNGRLASLTAMRLLESISHERGNSLGQCATSRFS